MRRTHLGVQAAIVLTMVAFVSWPQFRPVRGQSVWRYVPDAVLEARTNDAARFAGEPTAATSRRPLTGIDQTGYTTPTTAAGARTSGNTGAVYYTSAAVAAHGGTVNALLGVARTSLNAPIPYARLVLRSIRTGQVFARTVANDKGEFTFIDLDSNLYIAELLGPDGSVVATSSLVTLARGDVRQTVVRAAAAAATITTSLGNTLVATAPQTTTVAAGSDVTRTTSSVRTQESPR